MRRWYPCPCTSDCAEVNGCHYPYLTPCRRCGVEYLECELIDGLCDDCERLAENEWEAGYYA